VSPILEQFVVIDLRGAGVAIITGGATYCGPRKGKVGTLPSDGPQI